MGIEGWHIKWDVCVYARRTVHGIVHMKGRDMMVR